MKIKNKRIAVIILVIVILVQILITPFGLVLNSFYAVGTPLMLVEVVSHETKQILGLTRFYTPDYYSPYCLFQYRERSTRDVVTGSSSSYDMNDRVVQGIFFLSIWVFLIVEMVLFLRRKKLSAKPQYLILLVATALSVNIWALMIYMLFGFVNAVVSYGIAFFLYLVVYNMTDHKAAFNADTEERDCIVDHFSE